MKLDAIFQSLQIDNQHDIIQLLQFVILPTDSEDATQKFEIVQPDMVSQALRYTCIITHWDV